MFVGVGGGGGGGVVGGGGGGGWAVHWSKIREAQAGKEVGRAFKREKRAAVSIWGPGVHRGGTPGTRKKVAAWEIGQEDEQPRQARRDKNE